MRPPISTLFPYTTLFRSYVKKGLEGAYVYEPEQQQVREMVRALKAERPVPGNSLQITGGEPTLRSDLVDIVRIIKEEGVDQDRKSTRLNSSHRTISYAVF